MKGVFKWGFVGDLQQPYDDKRAVALFLKVMKHWEPDAVDVVGDIADFLEYSRFSDGTTDEFMNQLPKGDVVDALDYYISSGKETKRFFEELRAAAPKADIHFSEGNHECSSMENHRVITKDGYKSWNEIQVGDEVLSVNDDGARCWQPVEKIHLYPNDKSSLYRFDYQNVRGEFTDNHRFITKAGYRSKTYREHQTKDFVNQWGGVFTTAATNPEPDAPYTDEEVRLLAWCITDCYVNNRQWVFCQSSPKHQRILDLLDDMGIKYRYTSRQRDDITEICGKVLKSRPKLQHEIFVSMDDVIWSRDSHTTLPKEAFTFSQRQVELFAKELQFTDGSTIPGKSLCINQSNQRRRDDFRRLFTMNGISNSESNYDADYWRINAKFQTQSKVEFARGNNLSRVESKGVWCITVPNGRYFVDALGATHLTGNSRIFSYVDKKSPHLLDFVTEKDLWGLPDLGVTWRRYEEKPKERFYGVHTHHGTTVSTTGLTVGKNISEMDISLVRGHSHLAGVVYKNYPLSGRRLVGMETGHMCDIHGYGLKYTINPSDWTLGFGIGMGYGDQIRLEFIPIMPDYTCIVSNKVFKG